jgi:Zn-dependent peptidase ImmA (M78 family)/transcriptional regulator with XRE-family HTH domain
MPDQAPTRSVRAVIKPELLVWARTTSGLSRESAAKKIGVKPERLAAWEGDGQAGFSPTVSQLRKAANVYKRPLAVFFLPQAPEKPATPHDFRRLPDQDGSELSSDLLLEMRRARRRRAVALELLRDLDQPVTTLALRVTLRDDPESVGARGWEWLGVSRPQQARWVGTYDALNGWIAAFETRGFLIFQTTDIELDEMRGFSLSERRLPVIVLNAKDWPRARVFTLVHEFAHIMLDTGGVCDPEHVVRRARTADERVEVFCNHVAGAVLVPSHALLTDPRIVAGGAGRREWPDNTIRAVADAFTVSREVILRRLLILGRTTDAFYERTRREYQAQYAAAAAQARERARAQEGGGHPPVYRTAVRDNGRRYTRLILEAFAGERITAADLSDYLGVRLKHLPRIADAVDRPRVEA